jgi:ribosomal protein S16
MEDEVKTLLDQTLEALSKRQPSREISLVKTKLEEAKHWLAAASDVSDRVTASG